MFESELDLPAHPVQLQHFLSAQFFLAGRGKYHDERSQFQGLLIDLLLLLSGLLAHLLLCSNCGHGAFADRAQAPRVTLALVGEEHGPFSGTALGQLAQLLECLERLSIWCFHGKTEAIPTHQNTPPPRQDSTGSSRVTIASVGQQQVAAAHGYSSIALSTVRIGQLEKVANQIRQGKTVNDPPIR